MTTSIQEHDLTRIGDEYVVEASDLQFPVNPADWPKCLFVVTASGITTKYTQGRYTLGRYYPNDMQSPIFTVIND